MESKIDETKEKNEMLLPPVNPLEGLPLAERIKMAERVDPFAGIQPGWLVDARDTVNVWCVAKVLKVSGELVEVGFDGWSAKYDDTFKIKSYKICPFRFASKGYTGQVRTPLHKLTFSLELLEKHQKQLELVIESKFKCLSTAHDITQYLRGNLYIFTDFLMTEAFKDPKELPPVITFLKTVVRMIALWLSLYPAFVKSWGELQVCPKLMLIDKNIALASCANELIDMLKWFFCLTFRTAVFFGRYDVEIEKNETCFTKPFERDFVAARDQYSSPEHMKDVIERETDMIYGLFINFFNEFCRAGGLKAIYDILGAEKLAEAGDKSSPATPKLPLEIIASLLAPFRNIRAIAKEEVCKELATLGKETFFTRIKTMEEKDIRDLSRETVFQAMSLMNGFLRLIHTPEESIKIIQEHEMIISLKFLQSESLEKKLSGIGDIKKTIELVDPSEMDKRFSRITSSWLTADFLVKWITEHKILESVLNENSHPELVRRSAPVLVFLARSKAITTEILEMLWKCQLEKHEDVVRVVYDTISEILEHLSLEDIGFLFGKIQSIPTDLYDEKLLNFMKEFTSRAFLAQIIYARQHRILKPDGEEEETTITGEEMSKIKPLEILKTPTGEILVPIGGNLYCVPIFWQLLQDEAKADKALSVQALTTFMELMNEKYCSKYRLQYLFLCMENVRKNKSVAQSLKIAQILINYIHSHKVYYPLTMYEALKAMKEAFPLSQILLSACENYVKCVNEAIEKGVKTETIGEAYIVGKLKHSVNLEARLAFLEFIIRYSFSQDPIGSDFVLKLWNLFIVESQSTFDAKVFITWLSSERESTIAVKPNAIFSSEENTQLFNIICKSRATLEKKVGTLFFLCFLKHFKLINLAKKSIDLNMSKVKLLKFESLVGLDVIWENTRLSAQNETWTLFSNLLIDLYINLDESIQSEAKKMNELFIDTSMKTIMKAEEEKDDRTIANMIKLLLHYFDLCDGNNYLEEEDSDGSYPHRFSINATLLPGAETKKIEAPITLKVGQLRKRVADAFHLPFRGFQLVGRARVYDNEEDDSLLRNIGWIEHVSIKPLPGGVAVSPKLLLAQNLEFISHLFVLLSKEGTIYVNSVWDLLMALPSNEKILSNIEELKVAPESDGWDGLFDSKSIHKLLYSLQILERILDPTKEISGKVKEWVAAFCEKGGLNHIFEAFIKLPFITKQHPLTRKCFYLLITILHTLMFAYNATLKLLPSYNSMKEKFIERILEVQAALAQFSILPDAAKVTDSARKAKPTTGKSDAEDSKPSVEKKPLNKIKKQQEDEGKVFYCGYLLMKSTYSSEFNFFNEMLKFTSLRSLILNSILTSDNQFIRDSMSKVIMSIMKNFVEVSYSPSHPHQVLIPFLLSEVLFEALSGNEKSDAFFSLAYDIIDFLPREKLEKLGVNYHEHIEILYGFLHNHKSKEHKSTDTDYVLVGLMKLIEAIINRFPEEKEFLGQKCKMVNELLKPCLFDFPKLGNRETSEEVLPPKCKSALARKTAFKLLCTLGIDVPSNLKEITDCLAPIHARGTWRTKRQVDWWIAPEASEKSTTGYVGLKNLGCICYMNSLLQQFYMIPSFRNDVLAVNDPKKGSNPDENVLYQFQCLLAALNESVKQYYNPKVFCHAVKDYEGKSINVYEQMDVDEFFNLFLDRIEFSIKGTPQAQTIKNHFGGVFSNQMLGKNCPHTSIRKEPFLALNLQVKNKKSLQQCLESFVEGEMLQGSNAYLCEKCDKKITALKRVCIKRLPKYLICVLKRFDINYDTMQKFKINDYCEFPMNLNMEPYTEEGLAKKDQAKEREKAKQEGRDTAENPQASTTVKYPPIYYEYKLTGVVIHYGTADAGHYYSLIMDREKTHLPEKDRWFEFNDTIVEKYDSEDIKNDAFGGEEKFGFEGISMRTIEKMRNAYLLVYERTTPYDPPEEEEDERAQAAVAIPEMKKSESVIAENIHTAILAENCKYWHAKFLFNEVYLDFAYNLGSEKKGQLVKISSEERHLFDLSVFKYLATVALTTLFRGREKKSIDSYIELIKGYLKKNVDAAKWLLCQFSNGTVVKEFLLECLEGDIRRLVVGLLNSAMVTVFEFEKALLLDPNKEKEASSALGNFAKCLFHQLVNCRKYALYFDYFFQLFAKLAFLGPEMREYLIKIGGLKRLLGFWKNIAETNWNDFSDLPYVKNENVELGLSSEVDERFQSPFEEALAQRKERFIEQAEPQYTFLIEAISYLLQYIIISEDKPISPYALCKPLKGMIVEPSLMAIISNPKFLQQALKDCKNNLSIVCFSQAIPHLAWENMSFKSVLLTAIAEEVSSVDWSEMRKLFYFAKITLELNDSLRETYIDIAMNKIISSMKSNQNYFFATLFASESFVDVIYEIKDVMEWCKKNVAVWEWLITWFSENPVPIYNMNATKMLSYKSKELNSRLHDEARMGLRDNQFQWKTRSEDLSKYLIAVKEGKPEVKAKDLWFTTLYYQKFTVGQWLEQKSTHGNIWGKVQVVKVLDEMLYLRPEEHSEKYAEWVEIESENIALEGTHIKEHSAPKVADSSDDSLKKENSDDELRK